LNTILLCAEGNNEALTGTTEKVALLVKSPLCRRICRLYPAVGDQGNSTLKKNAAGATGGIFVVSTGYFHLPGKN
jgi:hypothetical protein